MVMCKLKPWPSSESISKNLKLTSVLRENFIRYKKNIINFKVSDNLIPDYYIFGIKLWNLNKNIEGGTISTEYYVLVIELQVLAYIVSCKNGNK